ncbi:hypothetical protein Bca4012_056871 [Brassica carinata]
MAVSPNSSSLELTISIQSFSPSPSHLLSGDHMMRDLDINQTPKTEEEREWIMNGTNPHVNEEDGNSGDKRRKKLRLTKEQSHLLEESFIQNHTLTLVTIYIIQFCSSVYALFTLKTKKIEKKERVYFLMIKSTDNETAETKTRIGHSFEA